MTERPERLTPPHAPTLAALLRECPDLWTAGDTDAMDQVVYDRAAAWLEARGVRVASPAAPPSLEAARRMDWQQVVLNGGPPCFYLEGSQFCGRAQRWQGHDEIHPFVSLAELLTPPAAPPPEPRDGEHEHLRAVMVRIAKALGHDSAFVLEMLCAEGESPAERIAREVEELVARAGSPQTPEPDA